MNVQKNLDNFNQIYDETYDIVLKYIVLKCSNIEDINDIIQETYLELYKLIIKDKKIEQKENYLIGIAKNKIRKHYNLLYKIQTISLYNKKEENIEIIETIKDENILENIVLNNIDKENIWNYLKTKKLIIQKIFYLYYSLDLTIKEISKMLNKPESYIKTNLYRTLKELKNKWGEDNV